MESTTTNTGLVVTDEIENAMLRSYHRGVENGKLEADVILLNIYNEANGDLSANELLKRFLERNTK